MMPDLSDVAVMEKLSGARSAVNEVKEHSQSLVDKAKLLRLEAARLEGVAEMELEELEESGIDALSLAQEMGFKPKT
jgi:hypothetical protein